MRVLRHDSSLRRKALLLALLVTLTALAGVTTPPAVAVADPDCTWCDVEREACMEDCLRHGHIFCVQECNFYYENCLELFC